MSPESYVGEKLVWLLGSILMGFVALITGQWFGAKDKVDKSTCDERRSTCVLMTNTKLDALHDQVEKMSKKLDKFIDRM
jgi:hypothetical protein